ncbi:hypothetical protein [Streptomyces sp. NPDC059909]|uniref:hypothetical protein n=1 Tax=Streptomyces sp. NPDC059909 TaxID=3346998 RepID=UPI0036606CAF
MNVRRLFHALAVGAALPVALTTAAQAADAAPSHALPDEPRRQATEPKVLGGEGPLGEALTTHIRTVGEALARSQGT